MIRNLQRCVRQRAMPYEGGSKCQCPIGVKQAATVESEA